MTPVPPRAEAVAEPRPAESQPAGPPRAERTPNVYPERRLAAPTPDAIQAYVEEVVGDRLGAAAVAQARGARTSIMAAAVPGRFNSGGPRVNVVTRSSDGWSGWGSGAAAPLPAAVGAEIDRLLASPALRAEPDRYPEMDCPDSGASLMVIRHDGRLRVTRQSCMPANLVGRLFQTVVEERVHP
jgi:hypothetical protein